MAPTHPTQSDADEPALPAGAPSDAVAHGFFGASPDPSIVIDAAGAVLAANPSWCRMVGQPVMALRGSALTDALFRDDAAEFAACCASVMGHREPAAFVARWRHADGQYHALSCRLANGADAREIYLTARPMDSVPATVSVEALAAGIAHEVNNPLAFVLANIDLATAELAAISRALEPDAAVRGDAMADSASRLAIARTGLVSLSTELDDARHGADRIRNIVLELKMFARGPLDSVVDEPAPTARAQPTAVPRRERARVLLVDDEPLILTALRRMLAGEHDVVTETNGLSALERVRAGERFDLVVSDMMMPTMSGIDLYAAFQRESPEHASRMIFLTGGAFTPAVREFLERVPNMRVEKPFDVASLRELVRNQLG